MMKRRSCLFALFPAVALSLAVRTSAAGEEFPEKEKKFEINMSFTMNHPSFKASYVNQFSPPFYPGSYTSSAKQTINLEGGSKLGFSTAAAFYITGNLGVQVMVDYFVFPLRGDNSNMDINLRFTRLVPPANTPKSMFIRNQRFGPFPTEGSGKWPTA